MIPANGYVSRVSVPKASQVGLVLCKPPCATVITRWYNPSEWTNGSDSAANLRRVCLVRGVPTTI